MRIVLLCITALCFIAGMSVFRLSKSQPAAPHIAAQTAPENKVTMPAVKLLPGMRAVALPASASSGLAGHVQAGDHVDVLFTQHVEDGAIKSSLLLVNAMVFSVNAEGSGSIAVAASDADTKKIAAAEKTGTLSLTLRSLTEKDQKPESPASGHMTESNVVTPEGTVKVIRGASRQPVDKP